MSFAFIYACWYLWRWVVVRISIGGLCMLL